MRKPHPSPTDLPAPSLRASLDHDLAHERAPAARTAIGDRLLGASAASSVAGPEPVCDPSLKYVRVTQWHADGLVAFDFAIGWPELSVELLLPRAAFDAFCAANRVIRLDDADPAHPHRHPTGLSVTPEPDDEPDHPEETRS